VQEDSAGYVEPDEAAGTERLLRRWFETSEPERGALRRNAADSFRKRFEIERAATSLLNILRDA
ncbi:MAG TPA: hypothetical protein VK993_08435, partial [Chthoniobacterales bacterium]|nr:hypothetical protein [Chthoniobacterales bacterium]